jgi:hypothetical protein
MCPVYSVTYVSVCSKRQPPVVRRRFFAQKLVFAPHRSGDPCLPKANFLFSLFGTISLGGSAFPDLSGKEEIGHPSAAKGLFNHCFNLGFTSIAFIYQIHN